jgi:hypothetical protein
MSELKTFVDEVDKFILETGMSPSTFGRRALNDSTFVHKLRVGERSPTFATVDKVREFMAEQRRDRADQRRERKETR